MWNMYEICSIEIWKVNIWVVSASNLRPICYLFNLPIPLPTYFITMPQNAPLSDGEWLLWIYPVVNIDAWELREALLPGVHPARHLRELHSPPLCLHLRGIRYVYRLSHYPCNICLKDSYVANDELIKSFSVLVSLAHSFIFFLASSS